MAIRAVRSKVRKAAKEELQEVNDMLGQERHLRITAERESYELTLLLARHGIDVPKPDDV